MKHSRGTTGSRNDPGLLYYLEGGGGGLEEWGGKLDLLEDTG